MPYFRWLQVRVSRNHGMIIVGSLWQTHAFTDTKCSLTFHFARPSPLMRHSLAMEGIPAAAATRVSAGEDSGSGSTVSSSKQQRQADPSQGKHLGTEKWSTDSTLQTWHVMLLFKPQQDFWVNLTWWIYNVIIYKL